MSASWSVTPLADVLRAQAADVREAARRDLIEAGARKEVLMMVPVVFLVLPVTVVFAFWPGLVGLSLGRREIGLGQLHAAGRGVCVCASASDDLEVGRWN